MPAGLHHPLPLPGSSQGINVLAPSPDCYLTVKEGIEAELKVKGSRFLAVAIPVSSLEEAQQRLELRRKAHHKASHHCWALRLAHRNASNEQADDDGEPGGTAGPPILAVVRGLELFDILVVVTRYFGGTKLGKGGLVRAYGEAARLALENARQTSVWLETRVAVVTSFQDIGSVEAVITRHAGVIRGVERDFSEGPRLVLRVLQSHASFLTEAIVEATQGRAQARTEGSAET